MMTGAGISDDFLRKIRGEFPAFRLRYKRDSLVQRAIGTALRIVTFGGMTTYVSGYHTVMAGTLWVSEGWTSMTDCDRYVLLRHERVHLQQARRYGVLPMALVYLFFPLPFGLAYGRARIEWEAYEETLRALVEVRGLDAARKQKSWLRARFVGPDYAWMWPFPSAIDRWFDEAMAKLEEAEKSGTLVLEETLRAHGWTREDKGPSSA